MALRHDSPHCLIIPSSLDSLLRSGCSAIFASAGRLIHDLIIHFLLSSMPPGHAIASHRRPVVLIHRETPSVPPPLKAPLPPPSSITQHWIDSKKQTCELGAESELLDFLRLPLGFLSSTVSTINNYHGRCVYLSQPRSSPSCPFPKTPVAVMPKPRCNPSPLPHLRPCLSSHPAPAGATRQ